MIIVLLCPHFTLGANLLFKSGFEKGVYLEIPYKGSKIWWQEIKGSDTPGFSWPMSFWGGRSRFQLVTNKDQKVGLFMANRIENVLDHDGKLTKALYQAVYKKDHGSSQNFYYYKVQKEMGDIYIKYWLKIQSDYRFATDITPSWRSFFFWKTNGDYRLETYIKTEKKTGKHYWYVHGDQPNMRHAKYWKSKNKKIPVPIGEWMLVELFWHRSSGPDGNFYMSINSETVTDYFGPTMMSQSISRIAPFGVYGGLTPIYQWIDDIEVWDTFPCGKGQECTNSVTN